MGMRDESWCNGCGTSVPYSEAYENYCGECAEEYTKSDIISFINTRIAELNESLTGLDINDTMNDYIEGAVDAYEIIKNKLEDK